MSAHAQIRALVDGLQIHEIGAPLWRGVEGTAEPRPIDPQADGAAIQDAVLRLAPRGVEHSPYLPYALEPMNPVARGENEPGRWVLTRAATPKSNEALIVALHGRPDHYLRRPFNALNAESMVNNIDGISGIPPTLLPINDFALGFAAPRALATKAVAISVKRQHPVLGDVVEIALRESVPFEVAGEAWFLSVGQYLALSFSQEQTKASHRWNISFTRPSAVFIEQCRRSFLREDEIEASRKYSGDRIDFGMEQPIQYVSKQALPPAWMRKLLASVRARIAAERVAYLNQSEDVPNTDRHGHGPWI